MDLQKELKELQDGKRELELEGYGKVFIENPTLPVSKKADELHSKMLNDGLKSKDEMLESEILQVLKDRGVWTEKDEAEADAIMNEININIAKLASLKKGNLEAYDITDDIRTLRAQRQELFSKRDKFLENSVESKARLARENFLVRSCTKNADGTPVWVTEDDMFGDTRKYAMTLMNQALSFLYSLPSNPAALFPENIVLDELEKDDVSDTEVTDTPVESPAITENPTRDDEERGNG